MKKVWTFVLATVLLASPAHSESVAAFLKQANSPNEDERKIGFVYWRGMLDMTMYVMTHKYIKLDLPDQSKVCPPKKKFPTDKEFFAYYLQYIEAEVEAKGRKAVEDQQMDQTMLKMWYALFNCENPIWQG